MHAKSVFIACTTMCVNIIFYISLQVCKEDIDRFLFRRRVPVHSCQMSVCWIGEERKKIIPLDYKITLKGAKDRYNFLTLTSDCLPLGIGTVIYTQPVMLIIMHDVVITS